MIRSAGELHRVIGAIGVREVIDVVAVGGESAAAAHGRSAQWTQKIDHRIILPPKRKGAKRRAEANKGLPPEKGAAFLQLSGADVEAGFKREDRLVSLTEI